MKLASAGLGGLCPRCLFADGLVDDEPGADGPATSDSTHFSNPFFQRSFGDYDLLAEVARGGMGVIYRARQRSLNRIVALKVLSSGEFASPEFVQRFRAEATAAARLQHPNIVAIHEVGEHDGVRYFTMDFVEGPNLGQYMAGRTLPPERAAGYLKTIAEAIQHAHQQGILHRDLKPSNVLIDPFGEPRVTDFGLAK
ncbi:MAG TPA: serine/threonine-protein kinase, partial [Candidatus Limnocylindria bacterium]|nr:serine/threonine-protein kinase [Candidatus Limnocylindria bacterium]